MKKTNSKPKQVILLFLLFVAFAVKSQNGVKISARVLLQGALIKSNFTYDTMMRDDLRQKNLLPFTEPYSTMPNYQHVNGGGNEVVSDPSVFQITGENAVVDWVIVELRDPQILDSTVATRSALLTRIGNVVDVDGVSPLHFPNTAPGLYFVVVRHRNHLGVMSGEAVFLNDAPQTLDFTNPNFFANGQYSMATISGKKALWCGDLNGDRRIIYQGPGNDVLPIFITALYHPGNSNQISTFMASGYLNSDLNMDGNAIYAGPGNDRSYLSTTFTAATYPLTQSIFICTIFVLLELVP